jgi:uncharacterized membrane protein YkvI
MSTSIFRKQVMPGLIFQGVAIGGDYGTGFIHGVNERIQSAFDSAGKELPNRLRPVVAVALLILSLGLAKFGITTLVAQGYTLLAWGVFAIYVVPLMTIGLYTVVREVAVVR